MNASVGPRYFEWEDAAGVAVVRFNLTHLRDDRLIRLLFQQLTLVLAEGRTRMLLNFAGVEALASYAIGLLIVLNNKLRTSSGKLALCQLNSNIEEIFDIMALRSQFHIFSDEQQALDSFS